MMNSTNSATHNSILYKSSSNNNNNNGRRNNGTFGTDGCQVLIDGKKCGETKNLQIIREFRQLYEDKMRLIDDIAGGDSIQAKVNLQQEWIKDLTDQNEMLVKVVEELEVEAAERVTMLERKLEQSAKCACKVMESYRHFSTNFLGDLQKMDSVQSDLNNLVELVRRAKRDGVWNIDGLRFDSLNINDVLRTSAEQLQLGDRKQQTYQKEDTLKERDRRIRELERQLQPYLDEDSRTQRDSQSLKEEYAELEKSMLDMRDALTAEVADKYDTIVCLRREVHLLEEQCRKSDQQTHFKDDIIKELRKELKQHKQFQLQFTDGKPDGKLMEEAIIDAKNKLAELEERSLVYLKERDALRLQNDEHILTIETLQKEIAAYKDNLRKSMENLIETQRELVKSKDDVERERGKSKTSVERSTNEPDEVESELIRENSALKEIATALKQESEVLAMENKPTEREAKARMKYLEDQLRHALMQKEQAVEYERQRRGQEVENLKLTIHQMDIALKNKDLNSTNLQSAVDLHANTVNVLEQAEERYRTEIAQQRVTITNLQDALVATKQELEELREKFKQDVSQGWAARWFGASGPNAQDDHNKSVHEV